MWHRGDWADLAHYGKYNLKACPKMGGEGKIMQPPSGDGQGIKKKLKKKAVISIWNVAGINFFITFNLSTGHCHHQSSSVQSDLCHSWQPAVPWGSDQQGAWPLKHPYRMSIPTSWDKHQDQGREGRGGEQVHPNFTTLPVLFLCLWHLPWSTHSTLLIHVWSPRPKQLLHSDKKAILFHSSLITYCR